MPPIDFDIQHLRINLKDVVYMLPVLWFAFELYARLESLEAGVLEGRIAALNMELSYMEQRSRDETEERVYEMKKDLVKKLMNDLEDLQ